MACMKEAQHDRRWTGRSGEMEHSFTHTRSSLRTFRAWYASPSPNIVADVNHLVRVQGWHSSSSLRRATTAATIVGNTAQYKRISGMLFKTSSYTTILYCVGCSSIFLMRWNFGWLGNSNTKVPSLKNFLLIGMNTVSIHRKNHRVAISNVIEKKISQDQLYRSFLAYLGIFNPIRGKPPLPFTKPLIITRDILGNVFAHHL